jgi:hypothetical protein
VGKGVRAARRRRPFTGVIATAVEAQQIEIAVEAAEDAAKKSDAARAARAARAAEQPRAGGRFVKGAGKKAAGGGHAEVGGGAGAEGVGGARATQVAIRLVEERLRAKNKYVREKLAALIEEHNAERRKDASSETAELLQRCQAKLQNQEGELRRLRRRVQAYKFKAAAAALHSPQSSETPRPIGGVSGPTLLKMANELNAYLETRFSSQESIQQALFQHNKRNRHLYSLILAADIDQAQFNAMCSQNPSWCLPVQKAVVGEIVAHYTLARCLTLQIQCRVGAQENYQDAINLFGKVYNPKTKKWERMEIGYKEGPKEERLHIPLLKSKDAVTRYGEDIHKENPILQDEEGTAAWLQGIPALFQEEIVDERTRGFLQSRKGFTSDELRVHFGGDAASYFRAVTRASLRPSSL